VVALQERGSADGLQALEISAGERGSGRLAAAGGAKGLLVTASAQTTRGYVPVRGDVAGAADRRADLWSASFAARVDGHVGAARTALRIDAFQEDRGAGLDKADSTASGASAAFTIAQPAEQGAVGWRLQTWVRASDLENSSVAVGAGRAATTPANDQYSTPALGYGLNAAWQGRGQTLSWEVGLDARAAEGTDFERFRFLNGAYTRGREAGGKTRVFGAYAEAALSRGPLILTGGVRADRWKSYAAVRRERDLANGALTLDNRPDGASGTTPTGRIGVRYSLSEALWLRAAAYAGFRPPTLNELHRPFRVGNDVTEANSGLKPETLQGIEAGLGGGARAAWSLTAFYNRLKDPITNVTIGFGPATFPTAGLIPAGGVLRQRRNAGQIEAYGLEGDVGADLTSSLAVRAAFSATRARMNGGAAAPQLTGKRPAQTPRLTATAGAEWRATARLRLSADLRYESARYEDDLNLRRLAPGAGLDLRAAWSLGEGREVYLAADNVAGARIEVGETADGVESYAAPRTIRAGFSLRR
jgi:outer membrane receptor protein involved in Fe transport